MPYLALFLLWPFLEIALFVRVSTAFGGTIVVALCVLSAVAGSLLIRRQGLKTMTLLRNTATSGEMPGQQIFDGFCDFIAGILLIIPGFLSDFVAISLLIPEIRAILRRRLTLSGGNRDHRAKSPDYIIEGEFTRVDDHDTPLTHSDSEKPE